MATIVKGEQYYDLDGKLGEIKRQLRQKSGYPFDILALEVHLQKIVEGRFNEGVLDVGKYFMTVKRGQYPTVDALRQALKAAGVQITGDVNYLLSQLFISAVEEEIDLWEISGFDLGFTEITSRSVIFKRAIDLGYMMCVAEDVVLARIQSVDTKRRAGGMHPLIGSNGNLRELVLCINCDKIYIYSNCFNSDYQCDPDKIWLFVRPRRR